MRRLARSLCLLFAVTLLLSGCGASDDAELSTGSSDSSPSGKSAAVTGTITVFAGASLLDAFTTLGEQFEAANAGTKVAFNFGPSPGLAEQIGQGAPADVFASASTATMDEVVARGDVAEPTVFVSNTMQVAVPPDNPAGIKSVADLAKKNVKVAMCQADVPCGVTALEVFENARIRVTPVTEEIDVKATLSKVSLGEVDAGVVYVTDVLAAGGSVKGIEIPADINAVTTYPIATLTASENQAAARAFVDYVLSPGGAAVLTEAGFSKP